ncbi:S1C family serine protease [Streptomyces sp. CA-294286]|uniref:S1C family serine protease n=1 Tax=Streptomyces sp. CA-294286 TaxID=3240070 RepID=UPI003D89DC89
MDEGKPAGPRAKWWSRSGRGTSPTTSGPHSADPASGPAPADPAAAPGTPLPPMNPPPMNPPGPGDVPGPGEPPPPGIPSATGNPSTSASRSPADSPPPPTAPPESADRATHAADPSYAADRTDPIGAGRIVGEARGEGGPQPLHDPDPYGTPPYGGPGPWAPAPPVQRPAAPPAHGSPIPPQHHGGPFPPSAQQYPPSPWLQYDPWSAAPQQPLSYGDDHGAPRKPRRAGLFVGALLIALIAGGVGGGVGAYVERNDGLRGPVRLPQADSEPRDRAPDSVAGIAASALPSVVTFHVSGGSGKGTGTGFVLDDKGHILTNHHVVDPAGSSGVISLTFSSGESAKAELVGKDSGYDLAVVKVVGVSGLTPLPLGNSDDVRVGDPVVAIGAPFDLQNTVTAGIISAKQRPITAGGEKGDGSDVSYVDALQTDAPINPGNSGGPLVDGRARVIGVNSAIRGPDSGTGLEGGRGGSIGLGFAIPINQAKRVAEEIINTGRATHPVIGVSLDMKYPGEGARVGAKGAGGAPSVTPGGPGAEAGIKPGDVITRVDGRRVRSGEELIVKIRARKPGDLLKLTLRRDGTEREVSLRLGSAGDS